MARFQTFIGALALHTEADRWPLRPHLLTQPASADTSGQSDEINEEAAWQVQGNSMITARYWWYSRKTELSPTLCGALTLGTVVDRDQSSQQSNPFNQS